MSKEELKGPEDTIILRKGSSIMRVLIKVSDSEGNLIRTEPYEVAFEHTISMSEDALSEAGGGSAVVKSYAEKALAAWTSKEGSSDVKVSARAKINAQNSAGSAAPTFSESFSVAKMAIPEVLKGSRLGPFQKIDPTK